MQSAESERLDIRVWQRRGSACATIWPRFSLHPPLSLSRFPHSGSCRAGNLLHSHVQCELWCCPKGTHTDTDTESHQVHVGMDHTAQRVLSLVPHFLYEAVRDLLRLCFHFFIEVVSIAFHSRISEAVKCKSGKRAGQKMSCCSSGVRR